MFFIFADQLLSKLGAYVADAMKRLGLDLEHADGRQWLFGLVSAQDDTLVSVLAGITRLHERVMKMVSERGSCIV